MKKKESKEKKYEFSYNRLSVVIVRLIVLALNWALTIITFSFADKAKMNSGIISSIFATSMVYTMLIFYCKYG